MEQKLECFDRLLSSGSRKKVDWEKIRRNRGHHYNENIVDSEFGILVFSVFSFRTEREMAERETEIESSRSKKGPGKDRRQKEKERAVSISNPADCQMTPRYGSAFGCCPSFLFYYLPPPFAATALSACHTLRVFKISMQPTTYIRRTWFIWFGERKM